MTIFEIIKADSGKLSLILDHLELSNEDKIRRGYQLFEEFKQEVENRMKNNSVEQQSSPELINI